MTRAESEKIIQPLILKCQEFIERREEISSAAVSVRPDVRRVSMILSLIREQVGDAADGNGLEIGSGYGYLLFAMAVLLPGVRWFAVDHPRRSYVNGEAYLRALREHNCSLATVDIVRNSLPYPDEQFSLVTLSEVLEHLPIERVNFIFAEIARVVQTGGILIISSPNQTSLENRIRLLRGKSILEMPDEIEYATGTFGHIRLYTVAEITSMMPKHGFSVVGCTLESNNSGYRGIANSWRGRTYRMYERLEGKVGLLRNMGDTWYAVFRKVRTPGRHWVESVQAG